MTSKLVPSNPSAVMVIRDITPNITTLSVPFSRFGLFRIGGRGTIIRLTSGALSVFSPPALTPEVRAKLQEKGDNVKYIIAPDIEHHMFISDWARAYPSAQVIGVEGLPEKRAAAAKDPKSPSHGTQVPFATVFTARQKGQTSVSPEFDRDFEYEYVPEHPSKELVFCYKPDKTLIVADYLFNLPATEQYSRTGEVAAKGLLTRLFGAMMTTKGAAMGHKRFLWYAASSANRKSFGESARRIETWDFERIIPCHGDVIEKDGKDVFRKVFEWHLQGKKNN